MDDRKVASPEATARTASNHLANERTFLAWVRTALSLLGLGFVLARMGLFLRQLAVVGGANVHLGAHAGREFVVTGAIFLILGTLLGGWSGLRYDANRRALDADRFEPARLSVLALVGVVVLGGSVIVGLVLWRTLEVGTDR